MIDKHPIISGRLAAQRARGGFCFGVVAAVLLPCAGAWRPTKGLAETASQKETTDKLGIQAHFPSSAIQVEEGSGRSAEASQRSSQGVGVSSATGRAGQVALAVAAVDRSSRTGVDVKRQQIATSGLAASAAQSQEGAFLSQQARLVSQLASGRETLFKLAMDKLSFFNFLGATSQPAKHEGDTDSAEGATPDVQEQEQDGRVISAWDEQQRGIAQACDVHKLPMNDRVIRDVSGSAHEEVLAQLNSAKLVREGIVQCTASVDAALGKLKEQFSTSLEANRNYAQSFEDVLNTLDDFKKTGSISAAFNKDHKAASEFLLSHLELIQKDIDRLKKIRPETLDENARKKQEQYEKAVALAQNAAANK